MKARNKAGKCEQINEYLVCKHKFVVEKLIEGEIAWSEQGASTIPLFY